MYRGKTVAVVVPAYNEAGFVGDVLDDIPSYVDRIYAVDDCSTDGTWDEILEYATDSNEQATPARPDGGQSPTRVTPIRHETNRGVGASIVTGYRRARTDSIDVTAVINGDGQMDPSILTRFIDPIVEERADYTKGDRLTARDFRAAMPTGRYLGNIILTFLTKVSSGYWQMNDPQNGYTAISLQALEAIDLDSLYERYGFLNDLLVTLNARGLRVADVPMQAIYDDEESGIRYSSFVPRLSLLLLSSFLWRLKHKYLVTDFHPLVFFYMSGCLGGLTALVYGTLGLATQTPVLVFGISLLLLFLSITMILLAMVFDMQHNDNLQPEIVV